MTSEERLTVEGIQRNETQRQREFPVCQRWIYFAHAGVSPLPRRVAEAIRSYTMSAASGDQEAGVLDPLLQTTRRLAAEFLQCRPTEVALLGPTSVGLSLIAESFPFQEGDNVVICWDDFPSNVYPWLALERKGVQVRRLRPSEPGRVEVDQVLELVDRRTALVALSSTHYLSGWSMDLAGLGEVLRSRGVALCVDAIQSLGIWPAALEAADFIAAGAQKWLLGPCGAGILCVRENWLDRLQPPLLGWHNVACPDFLTQEELRFPSDATRFEPGTIPLLELTGLRAALELLREVGLQAIWKEARRKRTEWSRQLQERGFEVLGSHFPQERQGPTISFRPTNQDPAALFQRMQEAGIVGSLRKDRFGRTWIRIAPHFYNTDAEFAQLLEVLEGK